MSARRTCTTGRGRTAGCVTAHDSGGSGPGSIGTGTQGGAMVDQVDEYECPHCGADLRGNPIPQEYIDGGYYAPEATHYNRKVGVEVPSVYDGILYWECPDCGGTWHRWRENDYLRQKAAIHMQRGDRGHAAS